MIETSTSLTSGAARGAASALASSGAAGTTSVLAPVSQTDVLVLSLDPGVLLGGAPSPGCAGRPSRTLGGSGYAAAQAPGASGAAPASKASAKTTSPSKSSTAGSSSSTSSAAGGALAFLSDSKLSVEEKLYRFMLYVSDKYDKALEKKMNEIAGKQAGSSSSSSTSKSGGLLGGLLGGSGGGLGGLLGGSGGGLGGLLGSSGGGLGGLLGGSGGGLGGLLGGALGSVLPAAGIGLDLLKSTGLQDLITQASGPVLAVGATAMGFPELAPVLLQAGPALSKGLFSAVEGATGGGSSGASSSRSAGAKTTTYSSADDPQIEQKDMLELQHLQDKQKEMFSLISNMLRSMHDTKMAVINNLRT